MIKLNVIVFSLFFMLGCQPGTKYTTTQEYIEKQGWSHEKGVVKNSETTWKMEWKTDDRLQQAILETREAQVGKMPWSHYGRAPEADDVVEVDDAEKSKIGCLPEQDSSLSVND